MKTLIHACAQAGIAEWVACLGTQNPELIDALQQCPVFDFWSLDEEATAAAFALGRCQITTRPVALLTHSPEARAAILPMVQEAYHQGRPLLVISTEGLDDAPCEEPDIFEGYAESLTLTLPSALTELTALQDLLREGSPVFLRLQGSAYLNGSVEEIQLAEPPTPPAFRASLVALSQMLRFHAHEGLVLIMGGLELSEQEPALWLAQTLRVPVLAEAASGLREELSDMGLFMGDVILKQMPPRYVLRLGDVPTGAFWQDLESLPQTEVFSITRSGFAGLQRDSHVIEGDLEQIMKAVGDIPHLYLEESLMSRSRRLAAGVEELLLRFPESEAGLLHAFSLQACIADMIGLAGASMRDAWNKLAQTQIPTVYVRYLNHSQRGHISCFLGNSIGAGAAYCLSDVDSLMNDADAVGLLPQLRGGKRVIAVMGGKDGGFSLPDVGQRWGAQYFYIHCEADFDVLDDLEDDALVLLEIQADPDQTAAFEAALARL
ncbi:MAG: thiamine pyrophosphate-binding protein [Akkermansia sp.]